MMFQRILVCGLWCIAIALASHSASTCAQTIDFNKQIRPVLSDRCYICHGPDEESAEADLRLDLQSGLETVVIPGELDDSELWARISSDDPDEIMPPPDSNLKLSDQEKLQIKAWIEQGAQWQQHWSFVRLPEQVATPTSSVKWGRNEIDQFVLAGLEAHGLEPQNAAAKEKLIRRLSFDLTGLPPTLEQIDQFVNDPAPNSYEHLVDRLLASPRFGERMASDWMDIARYSDTYGYQVDRDRTVWPWRDWVIRAFNSNKPYDQFLTEQIAGDLLPNANDQQILATTFNRLHPQKVEGGSNAEEFRVEYVADRAQTFATGLLGLTAECARCHDHKYDPITQKEYYELFAFFDDIDEAGLYSFFTNSVPTPTLQLLQPVQKANLENLKESASVAATKVKDILKSNTHRFENWLNGDPTIEVPAPLKSVDFESAKAAGDNKIIAGRNGKAIQLSGDDGFAVDVGNFSRHQPFSVTLWLKTPDYKDRAVIFHRSRAWTDAASRGYQLLLEDGKLSASLIHFWPGNAIRVQSGSIPIDQWIHVAFVYDGSGRANGLNLFINGEKVTKKIVRDSLTKNITGGGGDNITIGERFRDRGFTHGVVDDFKVFDCELSALQVSADFNPKMLAKPAGDQATHSTLAEHYFRTIDPDFKQRMGEYQEKLKSLFQFENKIQEIMVMQQLPEPKQAFVLTRGDYSQRAEKVNANVSRVLQSAVPFNARNKNREPDRLDLARWITDPHHPLTARVAVNRTWQMLFGEGIVRTPEDFGSQGKPPTHPELLDWLARDLIANQWNLKAHIKKILMSATYQQSSTVTRKALLEDPENLWLSHVSRQQLSAESIRDNALAVSQLLTNKIGGPPVKPYEVTVSFKPTARDKGANLYRRSVYTYWKRTGPAPVMMTLDASKRDVCRVKRQRTNSPLAALVLLNDPQMIEASRATADHLLAKYRNAPHRAIADAFRLATSREPSEREFEIARTLFQNIKKRFSTDPKSAEIFLKTGDYKPKNDIDNAELAAMTIVVTTLLNHDECVRKY